MSSVLKFVLILLAATVLAIGARILYVNSQAPKQVADPEVRLLAVAGDVPAGLLLREADLAWQATPKSQVPKNALVEGTAQADVAGALLRNRLEAGSLLKSTDIIRPDAPGFLAAALKPGMLAVSVPVNDVSGNAGLIQPGDYVDMILTQHLGGRGDFDRGEKQVVSETVVEQVRVIAVGSSFQRSSEGNEPSRARTITIEVRPRIAEAVTVASELGSLSLALRSFAKADRDAAAQDEEASVPAWDGQHDDARGPIWGSDVSRARQNARGEPAAAAPAPVAAEPAAQATPKNPARATIIRGMDSQTVELNPDA
ncbi:Flp pilus assembly protein CpaB [Castellaniella sp.]|uniref:Flp pilus assembly protein CpaB n=1 Tax=Castellaniella sp. TaxID=1955812 RepID=UPI00355E183F